MLSEKDDEPEPVPKVNVPPLELIPPPETVTGPFRVKSARPVSIPPSIPESIVRLSAIVRSVLSEPSDMEFPAMSIVLSVKGEELKRIESVFSLIVLFSSNIIPSKDKYPPASRTPPFVDCPPDRSRLLLLSVSVEELSVFKIPATLNPAFRKRVLLLTSSNPSEPTVPTLPREIIPPFDVIDPDVNVIPPERVSSELSELI